MARGSRGKRVGVPRPGARPAIPTWWDRYAYSLRLQTAVVGLKGWSYWAERAVAVLSRDRTRLCEAMGYEAAEQRQVGDAGMIWRLALRARHTATPQTSAAAGVVNESGAVQVMPSEMFSPRIRALEDVSRSGAASTTAFTTTIGRTNHASS